MQDTLAWNFDPEKNRLNANMTLTFLADNI